MNENKKVVVKKRNNKKNLLVLAMAGVLGCGSVLGASAFFTDQASSQANAKVGTFNMAVTDMSDLDGNYRDWATLTAQTGEQGYAADAQVGTKVMAENGKKAADFTKGAATDAANPSTGIINPGDTGIYAYKVENTAEKSMDTAKTVKVTVKLADGVTETLDKAKDANAYTIEGLGDPVVLVSDDGKTMDLYYAQADTDILDGSIEKDSGVAEGQSALTYAYNADFNRLCNNKFQGMDVTIKTTVYAKQHRNSLNSTLAVNKAATNEADVFTGTGDWAEIANFKTVA